jgi:DNA-binding GntR family transcriptional regulator
VSIILFCTLKTFKLEKVIHRKGNPELSPSLRSFSRAKSLQEQTYLALRASILSGEILPGEKLIETQIAQKLQVSRTPIREAIRQLQRENLLTAQTNGGVKVMVISAIDAEQLYDCRIALEELAVKEACSLATKTQIQKINKWLNKAEQLLENGFSPEKSAKMLEIDYQFHLAIVESSGNKWLIYLLDQVFDKMKLLRVQTTRHNPRVLEIRHEHRQVYEAVAQRDAATAVQLIRNHLLASKQRVVRELQNLTDITETR